MSIALGFAPGRVGCAALFRRRQVDPSAARLGEADGDGLFDGSPAVLSFTDMLDFFAHKFAGLGARGFTLAAGFVRPSDSLYFWHGIWSFAAPQPGGCLRCKRIFVRQLPDYKLRDSMSITINCVLRLLSA
jgi:hypothetical protein